MKLISQQYRELILSIYCNGETITERGLENKYVFGADLIHDCRNGFPIVDTHKVYWKVALHEIMWDLCGKGELGLIRYEGLRNVWKNFANADNIVPNSYYYNWRLAFGYDQILRILANLLENPLNRSIILQSYNPAAKSGMPQCHPMVIYSSNGYYLDCLVVGR